METIKCDICGICHNSQESIYCLECSQHMCVKCTSFHQKFNTTHHHKFILSSLQQIEPDHDEMVPESTAKLCTTHGQTLEYHCQDHDVICCSYCKKRIHEKCTCIKHLSEYFSQSEDLKAKCNEMLKNYFGLKSSEEEETNQIKTDEEKEKKWMERITDEVEQLKKDLCVFEEKLQTKFKDIQSRMKGRKNENERKNELYAKAIEKLEYHHRRIEENISDNDRVKAILEMKEELNKYGAHLTTGPGHAQTVAIHKSEHKFEAQHFVSGTLQGMTQRVESLNSIYSEIQRNSLQDGSDNTPSAVTMAKLKDDNSETSASAETPNQDQSGTQRKRNPSENIEHYQSMVTVKEKEPVPNIPIQSQCQLSIRLPDDNQCCGITGIADLSCGNIIMADLLNKKIKLCDGNGSAIQHITLDKEPRDIAVMNNDTVLITVPKAKHIQFVKISDDGCHMSLDKTIKVNGLCCGIAYCKDKIYTATQHPTQILIIDKEGNTEKTISGENLFERPTYLTVFCDKELIYVSDPNHNCVYGISKDSKIEFKYNVEGPHGITTDEHGNLFVADFDTMSIHLVSRTEEKIAELAIDSCPQKVFYNKARNRLLVTMWMSDIIKTFKLKDKAQ